jgi:hypothetical protein
VSPAFIQDGDNVSYRTSRDNLFHLGANIFLKVTEYSPCVDIRQYWKPPNQAYSVPTKKWLCLRLAEYKLLNEYLSNIEKNLPDMENVKRDMENLWQPELMADMLSPLSATSNREIYRNWKFHDTIFHRFWEKWKAIFEFLNSTSHNTK